MRQGVRFLNSPYQNQVVWHFFWISDKKIFDPFFKTFLINQGKNEDADENIWGNDFNF